MSHFFKTRVTSPCLTGETKEPSPCLMSHGGDKRTVPVSYIKKWSKSEAEGDRGTGYLSRVTGGRGTCQLEAREPSPCYFLGVMMLELGGKKITFTNLGKKLWPGENISKYDLIKYYLRVSPYMLPHLRERFLVLQRFPEGILEKGFFQKNCPPGAPRWLRTVPFRHRGGKVIRYLVAAGPETLAWAGNQAALEIHAWLSGINSLDKPDHAVFDLDPPEGVPFSRVCEVALALKGLLEKKGLRCFVKTSGARGLQVYLPLLPIYDYSTVRKFVQRCFEEINGQMPAITTLERKVSGRGDKIYLDYLQNAQGKTIVALYSPRPLPGAPVSAPLEWEELHFAALDPSSFHIGSIPARLLEKGDLFAAVLSDKQAVIL